MIRRCPLALSDLERALGRLQVDDRELLLLLAVEGLSYPEVAQVLQLEQVAVRKRVSRARARLAEVLDARERAIKEWEPSA